MVKRKDFTAEPSPGALRITGHAPTVVADATIEPTLGAPRAVGYPPTILGEPGKIRLRKRRGRPRHTNPVKSRPAQDVERVSELMRQGLSKSEAIEVRHKERSVQYDTVRRNVGDKLG
jgi:hypothetical protein